MVRTRSKLTGDVFALLLSGDYRKRRRLFDVKRIIVAGPITALFSLALVLATVTAVHMTVILCSRKDTLSGELTELMAYFRNTVFTASNGPELHKSA